MKPKRLPIAVTGAVALVVTLPGTALAVNTDAPEPDGVQEVTSQELIDEQPGSNESVESPEVRYVTPPAPTQVGNVVHIPPRPELDEQGLVPYHYYWSRFEGDGIPFGAAVDLTEWYRPGEQYVVYAFPNGNNTFPDEIADGHSTLNPHYPEHVYPYLVWTFTVVDEDAVDEDDTDEDLVDEDVVDEDVVDEDVVDEDVVDEDVVDEDVVDEDVDAEQPVPDVPDQDESEEEAPSLSLSVSSVSAGGTLTVEAAGFAPREEVLAEINPELGLFTADEEGLLTAEVAVPSELAPGDYTLRLTGQSSGLVLEAPLTVTETEVSEGLTEEEAAEEGAGPEADAGETGSSAEASGDAEPEAAAGQAPAGKDSGTLAKTGLESGTLAALGGMLLALGAGLLVAARGLRARRQG